MAKATKMRKLTLLKVAKIGVTLGCLLAFLVMAKEQCDAFRREPTGSSLTTEFDLELPFPAISICDKHFENLRAHREMGFPMSPFPGSQPQEVQSNPLVLYEKGLAFGHQVVPMLWRYYFTLDKKIRRYFEGTDLFEPTCRVGPHSCGIPRKGTVTRNDSQESLELEVPAGKWVSKFLADSHLGSTYLCHTLVPNVTVDFGDPLGYSIAVQWMNGYSEMSKHWIVYVHDKHEHVLLNTYALKTLASVTVPKLDPEDRQRSKKKMLVLPRLNRHPKSSEVLPCQGDPGYSENRCDIESGWRMRYEILRDRFGGNFSCRIPGIWTGGKELEVCDHSGTGDDGSLGLADLILRQTRYIKKFLCFFF